MLEFYELMTSPASKFLDKWFESEPLKATLATDSVIGAMTSPQLPGSGWVDDIKNLLHNAKLHIYFHVEDMCCCTTSWVNWRA